MPLFARRKDLRVQGFIHNLVNNNCPELIAMIEGPRLDRRVNLTIVVLIIPIKGGRPQPSEAFNVVTKEFSNTGLAIVLDEPIALDDVVIGFRREADMTFARGKAKHLNPLGGGFHQLGFRLTEMVHVGDHPELKSVSFQAGLLPPISTNAAR